MNGAVFGIGPRATWLGNAGLLPAFGCVALALLAPQYRSLALDAGFAYALLIFSFLGGIWWAQGIEGRAVPRWTLVAAVVPSLLAWALMLGRMAGLGTRASLLLLGLSLLASPLVDFAIARERGAPAGWLALRSTLSSGLGILTLALCLV